MLLNHLWPKLKMIGSIDLRINTTALYSDYGLAAAKHYEKMGNRLPSVPHLNYVLIDKAVDPPGEAKSDHEIGLMLVKKLEERAKARGMTQFTNKLGATISLEGVYDRMTWNGYLEDQEKEMQEAIRDNAVYGVLPEGTTLQTLREKGHVRWTGWGLIGMGLAQASTIEPGKT